MTSPTNEPKTAEQMAKSIAFNLEGKDLIGEIQEALKIYAQQEGRELVEALEKITKQPDETLSNAKAMRWMVQIAKSAISSWKARNQ